MEKSKLFYGWIIVAGCFMVLLAAVGIVVNTASLFIKPVADSLHFARGEFSLYFTIIMLTSMVMVPIAGKVFAKYSMRLIMTICGLLMAGGFFAYSLCQSLAQFYIASIAVGIAMAGASILPVSIMLTNWFVEKRGLAMGIAFTGSGIGGMLFNPLCNYLIINYGWQAAYQVFAGILLVLILPMSLFVVKASPKEKGLLPLGVTDQGASGGQLELQGKTMGEAIKMGAFWIFGLSILLVGLINSGVQLHIPSYLTDVGYSPTYAANIVAFYMGILILGKLILGTIIDKYGSRVASLYCSGVFIIAMVFFLQARSIWAVYLFAIFFGLANAMNTVVAPYITAELCGQKSYGVIYGVVNIFFTIGMAAGAPLSGSIFDQQSSYAFAWMLYAGIALVLGLTLFAAVTMGKKRTTVS